MIEDVPFDTGRYQFGFELRYAHCSFPRLSFRLRLIPVEKEKGDAEFLLMSLFLVKTATCGGPKGLAAEAALERADVGVVDVAVADEGHLVAHDLAAQLVGDLGDPASAVSQLVAQREGFDLLPEMGFKPTNKYLPPRPRRDQAAVPPPAVETPTENSGSLADRFFAWADKTLSR